jgi:hypothetical protein
MWSLQWKWFGLLLCNAGSVTHMAERLRLHTETVFRLHERMQNVNKSGVEKTLLSQQCNDTKIQGT